ncbi:hypothetical protein OA101_01615 [Alphaproteobacteria bacterium]|nr:hypothetical protein [Alphaproteobacteria bacterium]
MSHDTEAAWATSEIARLIKDNPAPYFKENPPNAADISVIAANEGRGAGWPIADGLIQVENTVANTKYNIALEYKRTNEGLHGLLTAMGQANGYLHKGYDAASIVVPLRYSSHEASAEYVSSVLTQCCPELPIAVFGYEDPDVNKTRPFEGKLENLHILNLGADNRAGGQKLAAKVTTQWAHVREGSTFPDALYHYLQSSKFISGIQTPPSYKFPDLLRDAVETLSPGSDPAKYLSYSSVDDYHNDVWRNFWFNNILFPDNCHFQKTDNAGKLEIARVTTKLRRWDGQFSEFFSGRTDSIKTKCFNNLNNGVWSVEEAWMEFAKNIRNRAHSFREDIDSGLSGIGLLEADGLPSSAGYQFVDAVNRSGDANSGSPIMIFSKQLLTAGNFEALIHYIFKLSEECMDNDPFSYYDQAASSFNQDEYLLYIEEKMANELCVLRKVSARGGAARKPFQAELAIMRKLGLVGKFRPGVGLVINWARIQSFLNFSMT